MKIILASQSQIRKRALDLLGLTYETIPSNIDEKAIRDPDPLKMAQRLSEAKAYAIGEKHQGVVIASDAFLVFHGRVLEKPNDLKEAHEMLHSLSGDHYDFITGIAVYNTNNKKMLSSVETCKIFMRQLSETEISDYIKRNPVLKFAGGHDTDGVVRFSEKVEGNCNFFTAIPMNKLIEFLQLHGIQ
jgi:septum formation protein